MLAANTQASQLERLILKLPNWKDLSIPALFSLSKPTMFPTHRSIDTGLDCYYLLLPSYPSYQQQTSPIQLVSIIFMHHPLDSEDIQEVADRFTGVVFSILSSLFHFVEFEHRKQPRWHYVHFSNNVHCPIPRLCV